MKDLQKRFLTHIHDLHLLEQDKPLLLGLSGGADSVCLFRLLIETGLPIIALHCNFHLRGKESNRDEDFVKELCKKHDIKVIIRHFDTAVYANENKVSIEMAARDLRYAWFEDMIVECQAQGIAIAHHQDDQAETLLLNLVRGTGLKGLAGMKTRNGHIIRPLLPFTREEILNYLREIEQDYVTDSTNQEREALRNKIRLDVIPLLRQLNPKASINIAGAAERINEALPFYEVGLSESLKDCVTQQRLDIKKLLNSPSPKTLLYEWLKNYGFNSKQAEQIFDSLGNVSGAITSSKTHHLLRDRSTLVIKKIDCKQPLIEIEQNLIKVGENENATDILKQYPLTPNYAYIDADKINDRLEVKTLQESMRFQPFGLQNGSKLVSDFLTDIKLNRFEKAQQPILCDGEKAVWIVGIRSDNRYRVTKETKRILQLTTK